MLLLLDAMFEVVLVLDVMCMIAVEGAVKDATQSLEPAS